MRVFLFALLSIGLVFFAFKLDPSGYVGLLAFAPYLVWLELDQALPDRRWRYYPAQFLFGILFWSANLYWVIHVHLVGLVSLAGYLALYNVLFAWLYSGLRRCSPGMRLWLAGIAWVGVEQLRSIVEGGFPWLLCGHLTTENTLLRQGADLFGVPGLSFLLLLFNLILARYLAIYGLSKLRPKADLQEAQKVATALSVPKTHLLSYAVLLVFFLIYGGWRIASTPYIEGEREVALVQGNFYCDAYQTPRPLREILLPPLELTDQALRKTPRLDLIVWSEGQLAGALGPYTKLDRKEQLNAFYPGAWVNQKGQPLFRDAAGKPGFLDPRIMHFVQQQEDEKKSDAEMAERLGLDEAAYRTWKADGLTDAPIPFPGVREKMAEWKTPLLTGCEGYLPRTPEGIDVDDLLPTNRAVLLKPDGTVLDSYDKIHLVPFGEYIPFRFLEKFLRDTGVMPAGYGGLAAGTRATVFNLNEWKFSVLICYEDIDADLARRMTKSGAEALVSITNDGWFKGSLENDEHLKIVRFRAIENRVPVLRAANNGISFCMDATGQVRHRLEVDGSTKNVRGCVVVRLPVKMVAVGPMLYSLVGEGWGWLCLVALPLLLFLRWMRKP